jgi:hypothetical protein
MYNTAIKKKSFFFNESVNILKETAISFSIINKKNNNKRMLQRVK